MARQGGKMNDKSYHKIERLPDGTVAVENNTGKDAPGVVCANPAVFPGWERYRKEFKKKKIYLQGEYDKAIAECLTCTDSFILSMNGYSYLGPEHFRRYGIQVGDYEAACAAILRSTIKLLKIKFPEAKLQLVYGASDMGVDQAIEIVAREFSLNLFGFSCVEFLPYAKDDDIPVYVADTIDDYADAYIRSLDLLITTGGREHALKHDVLAACVYNKRIHFVDVLNSLSMTGGVPATVIDEVGKVKVDNAAAAFGRNVSFFSRDNVVAANPDKGDRWDAIFENVSSVATGVCRQKMSATKKFN
jgi:hypothetical protein